MHCASEVSGDWRNLFFRSFLPCGSSAFALLSLCMWCAHHCSNRRALFPSGWYPLHALGSLCRRGLLRDQIRKTSLYTLHAFFVFWFPLLFLEVHFGSFVKYAVPDDGGFCVVFISTDKISEVVPITVTVPRPLPTSMFFLLCSSLSFGSLFRIFLNTWYWMSVCSHPHKLSVTVVFCDVIIFAG